MATCCLLLLAGCGRQSTLSPRSPQTHDIRILWWWMFGAAVVVFAGAVALLGLAWLRRDTSGLPFVGDREPVAQAMVVLFGIAIPIVVLVALFGGSDVYLVKQTAPPNARTTALTVVWSATSGGGRSVTQARGRSRPTRSTFPSAPG